MKSKDALPVLSVTQSVCDTLLGHTEHSLLYNCNSFSSVTHCVAQYRKDCWFIGGRTAKESIEFFVDPIIIEVKKCVAEKCKQSKRLRPRSLPWLKEFYDYLFLDPTPTEIFILLCKKYTLPCFFLRTAALCENISWEVNFKYEWILVNCTV